MKKFNKFTQTGSSRVSTVFSKFTDNVGLQHFIKGTSSRSIEPFLNDKEMLDKMFDEVIQPNLIKEWLVANKYDAKNVAILDKVFYMAIKVDQILLDSYYTEALILGLRYHANISELNIWIITDESKTIQTKVQSLNNIIDVIISSFERIFTK